MTGKPRFWSLARQRNADQVGWATGAVVDQAFEVGEQVGADATGVWHRVLHRGLGHEFTVKTPALPVRWDDVLAWVEAPPHPQLLGCYFVLIAEGVPRVFLEPAADASWGRNRPEALDIAIQFAWGMRAAAEAGVVEGRVAVTGDGTVRIAPLGMLPGGEGVQAWLAAAPAGVAELLANSDLGATADRLMAAYADEVGSPYPRVASPLVDLGAGGWNNAALSHMALDDPTGADTCWDRALAAGPRDPDATYNRSLVQWRRAEIPDDVVVRRVTAVRQAHTGLGDVEGHAAELLGLVHRERGEVAAHPQATLRLPDDAGQVMSVAITPDGRHALSGTDDGALRWWNLKTGACRRTLSGHLETVRSVAVTANGRRALSGSMDGTVRWWDLTTGKCLGVLTGHEAGVHSVAVTPDGRLGVTGGGADGTVQLWDLHAGRRLAIASHEETVYAVSVSADGRWALSAGGDGLLRLWDFREGAPARTLSGHSSIVYTAAMTPDGRYAISGGKDHELRVWDLERGECLHTITDHTDAVTSVAATPDGRHVVSGSHDRTVRTWDLATGRCLRTVEHEFLVMCVAVTPDGRRVVSGATGAELRTWSFADSVAAPWSYSRPADAATTVARSVQAEAGVDQARRQLDDGDKAGAAATIRQVRSIPGQSQHSKARAVWRTLGRDGRRTAFRDLRAVRTLTAPSGLTTAAMTMTAQHAVSGGWDEAVRYWDLRTGECLNVFSGHDDAVNEVAITWNGELALSAGEDGTVRCWDTASGECSRVLSGHDGAVTAVAVTWNGELALTGGADATVRWWDVTTGECLHVFAEHTDAVSSVALSPRGCHGVSGSRGDSMRWWFLETFKDGILDLRAEALAVALTPNCLHALTGEASGALHRWRGNHHDGEYYGHTHAVTSVAMTNDASHALAGSVDGSLRWWDLEAARCERIQTEHDDEVCAVALTRFADQALTASRDGALLLWELDWDYAFEPEKP